MQHLFPIVRRKRRPLVTTVVPQGTKLGATNKTNATEGTQEDAVPVVSENEKETDAHVADEDESR